MFDVANWVKVLVDMGVDDTARMELFLLAQLSQGGKDAANHVISKLLKHRADGQVLHNPSAFVHSCVRNARHRSIGAEARAA